MLQIQAKRPLTEYIYGIVILAMLLVSGFAFSRAIAHAEGIDWTGQDPRYTPSASTAPEPTQCSNRRIFVDRKNGFNYSTQDADLTACVYDMGTWRYAAYKRPYTNWYGGTDDEAAFVVSFGPEQKMYRVNGFDPRYLPVYVPGYKGIVDDDRPGLPIYKNITSRLSQQPDGSYNFNFDSPDFSLKRPNGSLLPTMKVTSSLNGKWLAFASPTIGIFRLNMQTLELRRISATVANHPEENLSLAISNDGRFVAIDSDAVPFSVYTVTPDCGDAAITDDMNMNTPVANPCAFRDLDTFMRNNQPAFDRVDELKFNVDGGDLTMREIPYRWPGTAPRRVILRAAGYEGRTLDYLALGDSYSSGEGDTALNPATDRKYYLPFTDIDGNDLRPTEKCHVSSRSYPFLIKQSAGISDDRMKSVACSGAVGRDDYVLSDKDAYLGQDGRFNVFVQNNIRNNNQIELYKDFAINNFIPGRIQQLEFADKYSPKAITLTAGGNDVGFGDKIKACLSALTDCRYAFTDEGKADLGDQIESQYASLKGIYRKTVEANPDARIYIMGYPQFVSDQHLFCPPNVQMLQPVRTMVRESVSYLNSIIKAAAKSEGIQYIDVENALGEHVLCGNEKPFVTGLAFTGEIRDFGLNLGHSQIQESFHPNGDGHKALAARFASQLNNESLLSFSHCENNQPTCPDQNVLEPLPPPYFSTVMATHSAKNILEERLITAGRIKRGQIVNIDKQSGELKPNSPVQVGSYSEYVDLGTATTSPDGSLHTQITIPTTLPAGYHTLQLHGKTFSGEDVVLTQIIRVEGPTNDIDEDGIPDTTDPCLFVPAAGIDADFDNIDDGCDPDIGEGQAYRVRNGDVSKGEVANFIYIERNTHATSVTGISGDSDPDNDGWAVVAASTKDESANGSGNAGIPAHFWIEQHTTPNTDPTLPPTIQYIPHVSVRTANFGCVQYTPRSLAVVIANKKRGLAKEAANTNTCRSESPEADTDNNTLPDNTQPLYRARNGDTARGEDPANIYLERSRAGAEVQLGLSDFAPVMSGGASNTSGSSGGTGASGDSTTGGLALGGLGGVLQPKLQSWNLLASSQGDGTKGMLKKLLMVHNEPVILVEKVMRAATAKKPAVVQCIALKPNTINVIKQKNQDERRLVKAEMPGGGRCDG